MKILEIRLKNLNSLTGEWRINLSHPRFINDGVFAITGPTGAGKTTIFDAICLALYGQTPRLGNIGKNSNDIMSRKKGECFAKVKFSTDKGTFWCSWEHRRSHRKSDGILQDIERRLTDAETNKTIAERSQTSKIVTEITGMDFERFTRAMLLAQGNFDNFLKAGKNNRAEILELITGTKIYSKISKSVFNRTKIEQQKLYDIKNVIDTLIPNDESSINEKVLLNELNEIISKRKELEKSVLEISNAMEWLKKIHELEKEFNILKNQENILNNDIKDFENENLKLENGLRAKDISGDYQILVSKRKEQFIDLKNVIEKEAFLPELKRLEHESSLNFEKNKKNSDLAREKFEERIIIINDIKLTDNKIKSKLDELKRIENRGKLLRSEYDIISKNLSDNNNLKKENEKQLRSFLKHKDINHDAFASEIEVLIRNFEESLNNKNLREKSLNEAKINLEKSKDIFKTASENYKILQEKLIKSTEESRKSMDNLRILLDKKTEKIFEKERKKLKPGDECPLCGSKIHPGIVHSEENSSFNDSVSEIDDLINQADDMLKKTRNNEDLIRLNFNQANQKLSEISSKQSADEKNYEQCIKELEFQNDILNQTKNELVKKISVINSSWLKIINENSVISLKSVIKKWHDEISSIEKRSKDLEAALIRLNSDLSLKEEQLGNEREKYRMILNELKPMQQERIDSYGDFNKKPELEEKFLKKRLNETSENLEKSRKIYEDNKNKLQKMNIYIEDLQNRIEKRKNELEISEKNFKEKLSDKNFYDEKDFFNSLIDNDELEKLQNKSREMEAKKNNLIGQLSRCEKKLIEERSKALTCERYQELEEKFEIQNSELEKIQKRIGELESEIRHKRDIQGKLNDLNTQYENQKKNLSEWEFLNKLIGSSEGDKFRIFAQKLTLAVVVNYANRQLKKMNGRYSLIETPNDDNLSLSVIDNDQGGEIRTTKNLSGGESFIISLALALGLSQISGNNVRVDSLFLDEGFGSLDNESLETALEALNGVLSEREGRMIGIISHVQALKERIATQIKVIPKSDGESELEGPGCEKI